MKALVIYDSVFGNTEKIAQAIGNGLGAQAEVRTLAVAQATPEQFHSVDLLVIGSPTRGFRPTEEITNLLKLLSKNQLEGQKAASFDTRIALETIESSALRFIVKSGGYAANHIAKTLKGKGARLLIAPEGFLVTGEQGPLKDGEMERAAQWAAELFRLAVQGTN